MKTIVSIQELAELEIKPDAELKEYYARTEQEIRKRWGNGSTLVSVACPACEQTGSAGVFEKWGLVYRECSNCGTIYVTARPTDAELTRYYRDSDAARFWRERIMGATDEARREKVIGPRVQWVLDSLAEYAPDARRLIDISSHPKSFLEMLLESEKGPSSIVAANPVADVEIATSSVVSEILPTDLSQLSSLGPGDAITAFDVLDRCSNVRAAVDGAREALAPGGLLFVTLPTSSGFEVKVLWDRSPTMTPPDKLNVLSIEGILKLFSDGWEILELSTPGMLDLEVIRRAMVADRGHDVPRFVRYLIEQRGSSTTDTFLEFLQMNRMTSFARLLARRTR